MWVIIFAVVIFLIMASHITNLEDRIEDLEDEQEDD